MFNRRPIQQDSFSPPPIKKKESDDCEIRVRRDTQGRVVGMKVKGKCSREDRMVFAKENGLADSKEE